MNAAAVAMCDRPAPLLDLRAKVAGWLDGEAMRGTMWRAGMPKAFRPAAPAR